MKRNTLGAQRLMTWLGILLLLAACGPRQTPTPIIVYITSTPAPTATLTAAEIAALNPSARGYSSMTYDSESDRVIMYGGQTGPNIFGYPENDLNNETWAYDFASNKWGNMKPGKGPGKLSSPSLAYDIESDRVILYGGFDGATFLDQTWAYDYNANAWIEMSAKGPGERNGPNMAYDSESDRVILFGGITTNQIGIKGTWAYDFNTDTWTEMHPGIEPPLRNYFAMTYDSKADRVFLWGSLGFGSSTSIWAYDFNGNIWQEFIPTGAAPADRPYPSMAYDAESDRTIMFGGDGATPETWAYDFNLNYWERMQPATSPGLISRHRMVYCTVADRVILFGGQSGSQQFNYVAKTWAYDFNTDTWTNMEPHP